MTLGSLVDPDGFLDEQHETADSNERKDEGDEMAHRIDGTEPSQDGVTSLPIEIERPLLHLLHIFAEMTPHQLLVFHGILNKKSVTAVSEESGFTKQNGDKILKTLTKNIPQLEPFVKYAVRHNTWDS